MNTDIRNNDKVEIKRITIDGMNMKNLLKDEFIERLDANLENYTLLNMQLILEGELPSKLVSLGHALGGGYKNNKLTISAENEENLITLMKLL